VVGSLALPTLSAGSIRRGSGPDPKAKATLSRKAGEGRGEGKLIVARGRLFKAPQGAARTCVAARNASSVLCKVAANAS
jgi:hypothetical protein